MIILNVNDNDNDNDNDNNTGGIICFRPIAMFPTFCRKSAKKPAWVPDECIWAHPSKKNSRVEGAAMTPKEFLDNEKKVLHAAYMFSGIDPSKQVTHCEC